jgi:hypothetical protein
MNIIDFTEFLSLAYVRVVAFLTSHILGEHKPNFKKGVTVTQPTNLFKILTLILCVFTATQPIHLFKILTLIFFKFTIFRKLSPHPQIWICYTTQLFCHPAY